MALVVLAQITAVKGKENLVRTALTKLIEPTHKEEGCIQYDLHLNNDDPAHFVFYEIWETRELWQKHGASPHIAANGEATKGAIESLVINELTHIGK